MRAGDVIAGRFELAAIAGAGGMGEVWRARDRTTGDPVALKVLRDHGGDAARFAREARLLAEMRHPGIVRYVTHGATTDGTPWIAMEWLEGEDLAGRLSRARLGAAESVALVGRAAEALGAAHARGIVHRTSSPRTYFSSAATSRA